MGRRKKKSSSGPGMTGQEWLGTYSDMVTLLLTFFILLYTFASVDEKKFQSVSAAFHTMFTGQSGDSMFQLNDKTGQAPIEGQEKPKELEDKLNAMYSEIKKYIDSNNIEATIEKQNDKRGVVLRINDSVLFELGKAELKSESKVTLDKIDNLFKSIPNRIKIEGHTDNIPIKNYKYESNWELSTARAVNVVKYYLESKGNDPKRFEAAGYGEYHPVAPNDTNEHRAMNRRVEILIYALEKEN